MKTKDIYLREYLPKPGSRIRAYRVLVITHLTGDNVVIISKKQFKDLSRSIPVRKSR